MLRACAILIIFAIQTIRNEAITLKKEFLVPHLNAKCKNISCPTTEDPNCVKVFNKNNAKKIIHIIALNKCELMYMKCHDADYVAKAVPMKYCGHQADNNIYVKPKRTQKSHIRKKRSMPSERNNYEYCVNPKYYFDPLYRARLHQKLGDYFEADENKKLTLAESANKKYKISAETKQKILTLLQNLLDQGFSFHINTHKGKGKTITIEKSDNSDKKEQLKLSDSEDNKKIAISFDTEEDKLTWIKKLFEFSVKVKTLSDRGLPLSEDNIPRELWGSPSMVYFYPINPYKKLSLAESNLKETPDITLETAEDKLNWIQKLFEIEVSLKTLKQKDNSDEGYEKKHYLLSKTGKFNEKLRISAGTQFDILLLLHHLLDHSISFRIDTLKGEEKIITLENSGNSVEKKILKLSESGANGNTEITFKSEEDKLKWIDTLLGISWSLRIKTLNDRDEMPIPRELWLTPLRFRWFPKKFFKKKPSVKEIPSIDLETEEEKLNWMQKLFDVTPKIGFLNEKVNFDEDVKKKDYPITQTWVFNEKTRISSKTRDKILRVLQNLLDYGITFRINTPKGKGKTIKLENSGKSVEKKKIKLSESGSLVRAEITFQTENEKLKWIEKLFETSWSFKLQTLGEKGALITIENLPKELWNGSFEIELFKDKSNKKNGGMKKMLLAENHVIETPNITLETEEDKFNWIQKLFGIEVEIKKGKEKEKDKFGVGIFGSWKFKTLSERAKLSAGAEFDGTSPLNCIPLPLDENWLDRTKEDLGEDGWFDWVTHNFKEAKLKGLSIAKPMYWPSDGFPHHSAIQPPILNKDVIFENFYKKAIEERGKDERTKLSLTGSDESDQPPSILSEKEKLLLKQFSFISAEFLEEMAKTVKPDLEEHTSDCPKSCPSRGVMVCARCKHGVYKTFLSVCHMRMFQCLYMGDSLELVSRHPCVLSGPFLSLDQSNKTQTDKEVQPNDEDKVLRYFKCKEQDDKNDPRCHFLKKKLW